MAKKEEKEYRALVGINYVNRHTGRERRVEAGEKIEGMNDVAARHELAAGHIEEWVAGHTENVPDDEPDAEVQGEDEAEKGDEQE